MQSRERVFAALRHSHKGRMPANYMAKQSVTDKLVNKLGLSDEEELKRFLGIDLRFINFDYYQAESEPDEYGYVTNMWGAKYRKKDFAWENPIWISPFDESTTVEDVHEHKWPDPDTIDYTQVYQECKKYHDSYVTFGAPWSPFFHEAGWLLGQENFFMWLTHKPEAVQAVIDHIADYEVQVTQRFLEAAAGKLDITYFGNDFGTQRGLVISPAMWQKFIRKSLKRFYDVSHDYGCKVMQHSCGSIREIIPYLIEDGVDILDPIQVCSADMDFPSLAQDFGSRLTLHGGMDTQLILPNGTTTEIRNQVRHYSNIVGERGGYILCGSQAFMDDIPADNILAMYDENLKI